MNDKAFKTYDIRGRVPDELNEELAYKIGCAFANEFAARKVVVGMDVRTTSPALLQAVLDGLCAAGCDGINIGLCGTEEVYFATSFLDADGGIMVTASHNPEDYNGMKFVKKNSAAVSADTGLNAIKERVFSDDFSTVDDAERGSVTEINVRADYVEHLLSYISPADLSPLQLVVNPGNGCAGPALDRLQAKLPFTFIPLQYTPDGTFPNGIPNPLLPENRQVTAEAVKAHSADMGIAWDGDFDRCFFYDEKGRFIEGYYIVALLAESMLAKHSGAKIIHDPRLEWATRSIVTEKGGQPIRSKTGHALIKECMRREDAVYGGEMSAHHYFRDFFYCDSGMVPWLLVTELVSKSGKKLSELVDAMIEAYPVSGEINRILSDPALAIQAVAESYLPDSIANDTLDGISMDMGQWRFNLRSSNTEPVVRLNVESRGDKKLMEEKTDEILSILEQYRVEESSK
ncbi:MAG: phosphomannomutase [Desulfovibrio sp.]